jgi:hypothetical protein
VKQLPAFRGLADDAKRVLATVEPLAHVRIKPHRNFRFGSIRKAGRKLSIAAFAYPDNRGRRFLYDPQFALLHQNPSFLPDRPALGAAAIEFLAGAIFGVRVFIMVVQQTY